MILEDGVEQQIETPPPEDKGDKGKGGDTVAIPKAEWERLQRQVTELTESERYWATRARGGQEAEPEPEKDDDEIQVDVPEVTGNDEIDRAIFEDPEKWTEALTKGPQAVEKFIKSAGYVRREDVVEIVKSVAAQVADHKIERRVQTMQSDSQLVGDFKDLQDPKSELFKETAPIYQRLVKMNGGKQTTALLYAAAEAAKAKLDAKKPERPRNERGQFAGDDDDQYERYDRRERARAQGSERGRTASVADDDETAMGPEAMEICKQMGISPADYLAQQKALNSGRGRRR